MRFEQGLRKIIENKRIAEGFFSMLIQAEDMAGAAAAGQFAHIRCGGKQLRRPISISEIDRRAGQLRLVYELRGEGTLWMSERKAGEMLDLIAPLGRGFELKGKKSVLFVGGGLGTPPLLGTAKEFAGKAEAILGFRTKNAVILEQDFKTAGIPVRVATDDGSYGYHGLVTPLLEERLEQGGVDLICTCGPVPMLKAVISAAKRYGAGCQASLEQRMGCGVGACLTCATKVRDKGRDLYMHVCLNGPVFDTEKFDLQL